MEFRVHSIQSVDETNVNSSYTSFVCYSYTLNTILGVGCLGIPYAVYHAGLVLGIGTLLVGSFLSYLTVLWLCETLERKHLSDRTRLIGPVEPTFEVVGLCRMYFGTWGERLYHVSIYSYGYGVLIAYAQVFIHALATQFPSLSDSTTALLYGLFVVPLSCLDLTEQITVQLVLTCVRFVAIALMCVSLVDATPSIATNEPLPLVDGRGTGLLFSTVLFAQFCHICVPGLIAPLPSTSRAKIPSIFAAAMTTTTTIYIILALLCSVAFGSHLNSSVNLNWSHFPWPAWACTFIVLFPAIDTLSTFPLIAINVGNSLCVATGGKKILCRLAASVPPILFGYLVEDLSTVLHATGIFGVYLVYIAPALLQRKSQACDPRPTRYSSIFSHPFWTLVVLSWATISATVLVFQLVL